MITKMLTDFDSDAGRLSIEHNIINENTNALTNKENDISEVQPVALKTKQNESAGNILLAIEIVVRFEQDSIADVMGRQKRNSDNN